LGYTRVFAWRGRRRELESRRRRRRGRRDRRRG